MFEVEKKFEINESTLNSVNKNLIDNGYALKKEFELTDYYPVFKKSEIKNNSFDFERYRKNDKGETIKTIKKWILVDGTFQRFEEEEKFFGEIPSSKNILHKTRFVYKNDDPGMPEITIDKLNFGGDKFRYFIEAEICTDKKDDLPSAEQKVIKILSDILMKDLTDQQQAPSMLHLILENS
jgi:hypothetical protein